MQKWIVDIYTWLKNKKIKMKNKKNDDEKQEMLNHIEIMDV